MKFRWASFEEQVRDVASHVYGKPCSPGRIAGSDIDGVISLEKSQKVLIEMTTNHTLGKVRSDLVKLTNVRNALFQENVFARCVMVTQKNPTTAMIEGGAANSIEVLSIDQFAALFLQYERYRVARLSYPFGSAVDPESGEMDTTKYVPVPYTDKKSGKNYSHKDIAERLLSGQNIVLIGEYGSGKSRCVAEVFEYISREWGASFKFPVAVNLRECWGLEDADEIVRRHFTKVGLEDMRAEGVRAYNRRSLIFLLDGFDEIGTQSWSSDADRLREVRAQALSGVQDAVKNSGNGTLITGREHYFSSDREMIDSLGLSSINTLILHVREEFTLDELILYFRATNIDVTLPDWLPRRPLMCQTIAQLSEDDRDSMFGAAGNEAEFWNHFIQIVCTRDARINKSFNSNTIYDVFVTLAELTRNKEADTGPINQRELQEAFESSVGALPVENASVMLQRLPSLGRMDTESADRRFIDTYILDGLRAKGITRSIDRGEKEKQIAASAKWINCLQVLGQKVLAQDAYERVGGYIDLAHRAAGDTNKTLASDIIGGMLRLNQISVDYRDLNLSDGSFSELDFSEVRALNLTISSSVIEEVVISSITPDNTVIHGNLIVKLTGASARSGLAAWVQNNDFESFDSVRTMKRIRDAGLNPANEILVVMLKKLFFQPGTGRKEEALLRGFESGKHNKLAPRVLKLLMSAKAVGSFKGNEGTVYTPNRAMTSRMQKILDELKSSSDEIWLAASEL